MTPTTQPRSTAGARREEILRAAVVEFAASGLYGTSTEAIATRAGVSQPYVFRLFGTKKALFVAAVHRGFDRVLDAFTAAAARAQATGADTFQEMGIAYIQLLADRDELMLQMQAYASCGDPDLREVCRQRYGELWRWLGTQPGATPEVVQRFMATGMLLNVAAAQDLMQLVASEAWAAECVAAGTPTPVRAALDATTTTTARKSARTTP